MGAGVHADHLDQRPAVGHTRAAMAWFLAPTT
jgi:hypothetical protein